ncbi:MAG: NapC/NirT family cytochrome c [Verrucomicrobiales bacterium]|nr:NapC/NirT family cytochrome c [Verrucomicrobiales bacterium]
MISLFRQKTRLFQNWLSAAGAIMATAAFFAFLLLFATDILARQSNPYVGILAYIVAPAFFFLGSGMLFAGFKIHSKHVAKSGDAAHPLIIDLTRGRDKRLLQFFVSGAIAFLLITAIGVTQTYHYTESNHFCGETCHEPMHPEFTAYKISPHARVGCVDCHVGAGAQYYVKAKINGVHQLLATAMNNYQRPIPTPVKNLRPAQDTCEQCHWPEKLSGNLDRTYHHFLSDEANTPFSVRVLLKVGASDTHATMANGIHWHINLTNSVEYFSPDPQRQTIPWVRVKHADGTTTVYRAPDFKDEPDPAQIRRMDCLDCHNRPAHRYRAPNESVDLALQAGTIDRSLPWVKSNVVALLVAKYDTEPEALQKISSSLRGIYKDHPTVENLVATSQDIYRGSFFPEMKADWRAYPDNKGHKEWPGCFRCHDGLHKTTDGRRSIGGSECNSCHVILAQGSTPEELKKLNADGHTFFHIDADYTDLSCNGCHTGAFIRE